MLFQLNSIIEIPNNLFYLKERCFISHENIDSTIVYGKNKSIPLHHSCYSR